MTENIKDFKYIARVSIEFTTPFHIGTGAGDDTSDAMVVCDANGLPAIPGSSLAGILRSEYERRHGTEQTNSLFGFQTKNNGAGSLLRISWACIHDSKNTPIEGLVSQNKIIQDAVLSTADDLTLRDHVRINHLGSSDAEDESDNGGGHGKFDERVVCAGHRFTFEMELTGSESHKEHWQRLLELIFCPTLRIGGRTRRGLGSFKVISVNYGIFDLNKDLAKYLSHPGRMNVSSKALEPYTFNSHRKDSSYHTVEFKLEPDGYWMFGGGFDVADDGGNADMTPVRDRRVKWENNVGEVIDDLLVIPGSSIKGALSHRVAYHYNALAKNWAENLKPEDFASLTGESNHAVKSWFGYCKDKDADGRRGKVLIDDIFVENCQQQFIHHVTIDRYTGGAVEGHLFSERPIWKGDPVKIRITLLDTDSIQDTNVLLAMKKSLDDLADKRLQLGAGSGRGYGRFNDPAPLIPELLTRKEVEVEND